MLLALLDMPCAYMPGWWLKAWRRSLNGLTRLGLEPELSYHPSEPMRRILSDVLVAICTALRCKARRLHKSLLYLVLISLSLLYRIVRAIFVCAEKLE